MDNNDSAMTELDEFWAYDNNNSNMSNQAEEELDDLSTSFRCYRGPALTAVALFCAAYSLRVWRRNGVACDQLLFLPGTPHEFRCSSSRSVSEHSRSNTSGRKGTSTNNDRGESNLEHGSTSGDAGKTTNNNSIRTTIIPEGDAAAGASKSTSTARARSHSHEDTLGVMNDMHASATLSPDVELRPLMLESPRSNSASNSPTTSSQHTNNWEDSPIAFIRDQAIKGIDMLVVRKPLRPLPLPMDENNNSIGDGASSTPTPPASNEMYDEEYAPSAPSVLGAALDLSLPVLFNFHMFVVLMKDHYKKESQSSDDEHYVADSPIEEVVVEGNNKIDVKDVTWMTPPQVPPKVLPLIFITPLIIRSVIPRRQRRRFFNVILQGTALSPFKPVRFRDAFVADCVTSLVRPLGDLIFAFSYYFIAIFGFFGKYTLNEAGTIASKAAVLHGIVLPVLSILPIFVAFLQTLRQAYDSGKRWPYLGNSFKYLTAGLIVLYGMTHTAGKRSTWWTWSFVLATIYQFIWDVCFDWELLVFVPRESVGRRTTTLTSVPILRRLGGQIKLRPKRLFEDDSFYWKALLLNAILRFCWMAGFIPAYRVSIIDGSTQVTFVDVAYGWSFVLMAVAEIFRRTLWAIIKVELETIKLSSAVENGVVTATSVDEYMKGGRRNASTTSHEPTSFSPTWRCRPSKSSKPVQDEDTTHDECMQLEPTTSLNSPSKNASGKNNDVHRWLCLWVSSGFIRWIFIMELLLWTVIFCLLSYYVILAE